MLINSDFSNFLAGGSKVLIFPTSGTPILKERLQNTNPFGWTTWMLHGCPVEHDPENTIGWAEVHSNQIHAIEPYLDPPRIDIGFGAAQVFTTFRIHDGGFFQQIEIEPGTNLRLSARAHAWSNHTGSHVDDPYWSEGPGYDAGYALEGEDPGGLWRNATFYLGIDPTGGVNPYAQEVSWGRGAHIYNAYGDIPAIERGSKAGTVTVFLRSRFLWPFKHCDAHFDSVRLEVIPPPVQGYDRTVHLIPRDITDSEFEVVRMAALGGEQTISWSFDDAFHDCANVNERNVIVWEPERVAGSIEELERHVLERWPPLPEIVYKWFSPEPPEPSPLPPVSIIVGVHDEEAAGAFQQETSTSRACVLVPQIVENVARSLDYSHLKTASCDLDVIVRLNWSWAHPSGKGTIPPPNELRAHTDAITATIRAARGVDFWQLWNEPNNKSEMPNAYNVTPEYVAIAYNEVYRALVGTGVKISPPPIDPKYGPGSNNRDWTRKIFEMIDGAGALIAHVGKSQTNDPMSVWSEAKFADDPLTWQYLNSKDLYTFMEDVPDRFKDLPVILGEVNPQFKFEINGELGWVRGNYLWVTELMRLVRSWNAHDGPPHVSHVVFYRWDYDSWRLKDKPGIVQAILKEASRYAI